MGRNKTEKNDGGSSVLLVVIVLTILLIGAVIIGIAIAEQLGITSMLILAGA